MHFADCIYIYYIEYIVGKYMQVFRSLLVLPVVGTVLTLRLNRCTLTS